MQFAIRPYLPRRGAFLFLIAILVPCVVLVALSLRMIEQERQLEDKRFMEDRQRAVDQVRQGLLSQLEKIKLEEVTRMAARTGDAESVRSASAVAFVATLHDGRLQLPWES